ncbi:MAG: hypothetical protein O4861_16175 [Trichodesmium sp. St16_bin4-tuft]|nr:hypothetical protein [Trichodesmium sp. St5_bin8]MDE5076904.1 hypothetical protein [Trichodesmium sp. St2_bin6]MDE5092266.1 hypothetical protein [Trichodesmium sp. St18_bin3_1_1]MDE5095640.1 hypothetical protein [Trichodesmium sp. St11_bin5]MDE5099784.1 hypothetical protein [Trichodesmium sp. St16_bin4-tuft]MDE5102230.1 hypothetical protein [Trichodesmium sp. St19_bin2]MDT9339420.1 hypothetical protein [Trichodesmium erythraeum 21-75]
MANIYHPWYEALIIFQVLQHRSGNYYLQGVNSKTIVVRAYSP